MVRLCRSVPHPQHLSSADCLSHIAGCMRQGIGGNIGLRFLSGLMRLLGMMRSRHQKIWFWLWPLWFRHLGWWRNRSSGWWFHTGGGGSSHQSFRIYPIGKGILREDWKNLYGASVGWGWGVRNQRKEKTEHQPHLISIYGCLIKCLGERESLVS